MKSSPRARPNTTSVSRASPATIHGTGSGARPAGAGCSAPTSELRRARLRPCRMARVAAQIEPPAAGCATAKGRWPASAVKHNRSGRAPVLLVTAARAVAIMPRPDGSDLAAAHLTRRTNVRSSASAGVVGPGGAPGDPRGERVAPSRAALASHGSQSALPVQAVGPRLRLDPAEPGGPDPHADIPLLGRPP